MGLHRGHGTPDQSGGAILEAIGGRGFGSQLPHVHAVDQLGLGGGFGGFGGATADHEEECGEQCNTGHGNSMFGGAD